MITNKKIKNKVRIASQKSDSVLTLNKFKKIQLKEINSNYISIEEIKKVKLISNKDLNKFISSGVIEVCQFRNREYVSRKEFFDLLKNNI